LLEIKFRILDEAFNVVAVPSTTKAVFRSLFLRKSNRNEYLVSLTDLSITLIRVLPNVTCGL